MVSGADPNLAQTMYVFSHTEPIKSTKKTGDDFVIFEMGFVLRSVWFSYLYITDAAVGHMEYDLNMPQED